MCIRDRGRAVRAGVELGLTGFVLGLAARHTSACGGCPRDRVAPSVAHFTLGAKQGDGELEVLKGVEGLVDAGKSQVGDLVELSQRSEEGHPDLCLLYTSD